MKALGMILAVLVVLLALIGPASAQTWYKTDASLVGWDPVTTMETATGPQPLPAGDAITYRLYLKPQGGEPATLGETAELTYTVQLPAEGRWLPGVSALRWVDGEMVGESEISWSDGPLSEPGPWGLRYFNPPGRAHGVRKQ